MVTRLILVLLMAPILCYGQVKLVTIPSGRTVPSGGQNLPVGAAGQTIIHNGTRWSTSTNASAMIATNQINVTLSSSQTSGEINAVLSAIPRNLGGQSLYIYFNTGSYTFTNPVSIGGFYNGWIYIRPVASWSTTTNTSQPVAIAGGPWTLFYMYNNSCYVDIQGLRFVNSLNTGSGIYSAYAQTLNIAYCSFSGTAGSGATGIYANQGGCIMSTYNWYATCDYAIYISSGTLGNSRYDQFAASPSANGYCFCVYNGGYIQTMLGTYNYGTAFALFGSAGLVVKGSGATLGT